MHLEIANLKSQSDENVGSKCLSVPKICLFLCFRLLHSIKVLVTTFSIKFSLFDILVNISWGTKIFDFSPDIHILSVSSLSSTLI